MAFPSSTCSFPSARGCEGHVSCSSSLAGHVSPCLPSLGTRGASAVPGLGASKKFPLGLAKADQGCARARGSIGTKAKAARGLPRAEAAQAASGAAVAAEQASTGAASSAGTPNRLISFPAALSSHGLPSVLTRRELSTLQINIGLYCNQACAHCHVDSSPQRTEMMDRRTAQRIVELMSQSPGIRAVDLTGGAPELNPQFRYLVTEARMMGKEVVDRCNLTVLFEPGQEDLATFLRDNQVRVVASLPCYSASNVDKQRGKGVFDLSIQALQLLNSLGYGQEGSGLLLDLVYNPVGPSLPPAQSSLEPAYKSELLNCYGVVFNNLLTITNMPIKRFQEDLERKKVLDDYMHLLVSSFNPAAVQGLMCTNLVSIQWDGAIFDCDFNQQLGLGLTHQTRRKKGTEHWTVFDIDSFEDLVGSAVAVKSHCFGCTAGNGSSCTGALA